MAGVGRQVLDSRSVSPLQPRAAVYPFWRPTEWQGEYSPQPQKRPSTSSTELIGTADS